MTDLGELLPAASLLVTATLLGLALREIAKAWRTLAETRTLEATVRLEKVRLRREELAAEERERARREAAPKRVSPGFRP